MARPELFLLSSDLPHSDAVTVVNLLTDVVVVVVVVVVFAVVVVVVPF